ncbi:MAG: class I SAM-dependent methyltransferase [Anaerolineales bacterium]
MTPSQQDIARRVLESRHFEEAEMRRIYDKYFRAPSATVQTLLDHYDFGKKRVLVVGCSYGYELIYFGAESVGVDIDARSQAFGQAIGLDIRLQDVEEAGLPVFDQPFEAAFCSNLLEHVMAPHVLLARFRRVLGPGGLLAIKVPLTPPRWVEQFYARLGRHHGCDHHDHINFYTRRTLRWTLERAGYTVIRQHSPILSRYGLNSLAPLAAFITPSTIIVSRVDPDFQPASRRVAHYEWEKTI